MCCFAQKVLHVGRTKLFARLTGSGSQQLAYSMDYKSEVPNAMILPLPTPPGQEDAVKFIDLSGYENFFSHLQRGFPRKKTFAEKALPMSRSSATDAALEVHQVGDFVASFVPGIQDFERLDPQFTIPAETWKKLPEYASYGFAVFQLKELAGRPHPMAFEFQTQLKEQVFFPTVHIHDGQVHKLEEFQHELYLQHAALDSIVGGYRGPNNVDPRTQLVRSQEAAGEFVKTELSKNLVLPDLLLHRMRLEGLLPNQDTLVPISGDPLQTTFNWTRARDYWPLALPATAAAGGLAFFIKRRQEVQSQTAPGPGDKVQPRRGT